MLIPFNTVSLYGMERGVIETFDLLRPEVTPHFLLSYTTRRRNLPILAEVERRGLNHSFFSDKTDWPKIGWPRSWRQFRDMTGAMIRGNLDVLRASRGKEIIYLPSVHYFYFAILASVAYRIQRKRIIYHFHDLVSHRSSQLRVAALSVTDFVHNTRVGYDAVTSANPYLVKRRNAIIPCPIGARAESGDARGIKAAFDGRNNIVFVGQVARHKGVDLLLDAFSLLANYRDGTTLHIVGGCDDPVIKSRLNRQGPNGCEVKYWGYRDDVLDLLRRADVYVHPSPPSRCSESFGRGVVEAMSVGVPAVCFRSGALRELVVHEGTGLVCEEETPECLAHNLERFLADDELRRRCGDRAREEYEKRYSDAYVKSQWRTLIDEGP